MKRHWPILIVVMLAVMAVKRQLSSDAARSEGEQLTTQLVSLNTSRSGSDVATNTTLQMEAVDLKALRDDAFRIHQLRGEVTLAQQRVGNLTPLVTNLAAKLHARTNQVENLLAPEFPPGYLPRHELADRGNATPEAALETFWWAMSRGNLPRLFAVAAEMAGQPVPENPSGEGDGFTHMFRSFPGYQLVKRENSAAGRLIIGLRTAPEARVVDMILTHTNGQWLVSIESLQNAFEGAAH
jgi:hypothetical protein